MTNWTACEPDFPAMEAFRPKYYYETFNASIKPSQKGTKDGPYVNQVRDPYVFKNRGQCYIYYLGGGESNVNVLKTSKKFCYAPHERDIDEFSSASRLTSWIFKDII